MGSARSNNIRCQFCGVSGNVGRMRLATDPPETVARRMQKGVPLSNDADCVGCFVVADDDQGDDDSADVSFAPTEVESPRDAKYEYMPASSSIAKEDVFDDMSDDDDDEDYEDEDSEMEIEIDADAGGKSYMHFLNGLPTEEGATIVPLTEEYKQRDETWRSREHISGPNCMLRNAYLGQNISADEIRGCNTFQVLAPKPSDWKPETGDEDFELNEDSPCYLSGLRDHLDCTANTATIFAPTRHGSNNFHIWNWDGDSENRYFASMPFHPACFEVFKRASIKRFNTIDVSGLSGWYQIQSSHNFMDKIHSQDEALKRSSKGGTWNHIEGDEWIAANPCFVPALDTEMHQLATNEAFKGSPLSESRDIDQNIDEIAQMNLSSEASTNLPQSFYFGHIRQDMPWIWEAWCTRPYSGWATRTQSEISKDPLAVTHQRDYLQNWVTALEADDETSTEKRAQLRDLKSQIKELEDKSSLIPEPTAATQLARTGTDWRKLYFALKELGQTSNGLRNRERIWRCCNHILDGIEEGRRKGKINTNNNVRLPADLHGKRSSGRHRGLDFSSDYSEGEAEFSDDGDESDNDMNMEGD